VVAARRVAAASSLSVAREMEVAAAGVKCAGCPRFGRQWGALTDLRRLQHEVAEVRATGA
jgi:hypothetical protein